MRMRSRGCGLIVLFVLVAGCAAPRLRPDAATLMVHEQRERAIAAQPAWGLNGRLAVAGPDEGGSGSLTWTQDGANYRFSLNAPVTGKTWILSGDAQRAQLEGLRAQPVLGADAATLLERELGWQVPVDELAAWVRGVRAPGRADLLFRADGLPAELVQAGWKVQYLDYDLSQEPPLPRRIFASRGEYKVRLVVQRWNPK